MGELINLPEPKKISPVSLEEVISARRSRRKFLPRSLTMGQISQLCWAAQGMDAASGFRNVPSAGATYPLELFVVTTDGLFHYLPAEHALDKLTDSDLRAELSAAAWGQRFIKEAPLTLAFAAELARTTGRYGRRGIRYVYTEAGHAAQNIHLQAESLELASVAVGAFEDAAVSKVLSLPANLEPVYMVVVGYWRR